MVIPERKRPDLTPGESAKDGAPSGKRNVSYSQPSPADRIRELINRTGLSQRAAAQELEVDDRTLRYWCSGKKPVPRMAFLAFERLIEMRRTITDK